jgi:hypothetical protein
MKLSIIVGSIMLVGMALPPGSGEPGELIVVANSIDSGLNIDSISYLQAAYPVKLVHPSDFNTEMYHPFIIILGGNTALEGTGDIVNPVLFTGESLLLEREGAVLVKLNVWTYNQAVIIIAGSDRERTKSLCDSHVQSILSLMSGIQSVRTWCDGDGRVLAFLWPSPVGPEDQIVPYLSLQDGLPQPYELCEPCWFFWIDEYPCAKFSHPCQFIFIGTQTGSMTVHQEAWWPVLNGEPVWTSPEYWNSTYWVTTPAFSRPISSFLDTVSSFQPEGTDRALIINGWAPGHPLKEDMREDQQQMKTALTTAGLNVASVTTLEGMGSTCAQWSVDMTPGSTFLLYITAHGSQGSVLIGETLLPVVDLRDMLMGFGGVHVIIIVDAPYAGTFIDELKTSAEAIIVASTSAPVYGDWDPENDVNPTDGGSEFTSSLIESIQHLITDRAWVEQTHRCAVTLRESYYTLLAASAFVKAQDIDAGASMHCTAPCMWRRGTDSEFIQKEYKEESDGCACGH